MNTSTLLIALVFVLAGLVKGVTGMGLPTVAMALLTLTLPPLEAAALLIVPSAVTNVWQLAMGPALYPLWLRLWPMLLSVCAGTALGGCLLMAPAEDYASTGAAGVATGVLAGVTGVFVMPVAPYLQALNLENDDLVQALGMAFTVSTLALAVLLTCRGNWQVSSAGGSVLALVPAGAGMLLGQWLRYRMPAAVFRRCFFVSLLALGAHQCLRVAMA